MNICLRYIYTNVTAIIVTFGLFFIMQQLISKGSELNNDDKNFHAIDFIRTDRKTELITKQFKPQKPPEPIEQPETVSLEAQSQAPALSTEVFELGAVDINPSFNIDANGLGLGGGSGALLPVVQVAPRYPPRALNRGIEGYAVVEFTVDTDGSITDARIIDSEPPGVFDKVSLMAIQKFKYKPRVINGQAVRVPGQRKRFKFHLSK